MLYRQTGSHKVRQEFYHTLNSTVCSQSLLSVIYLPVSLLHTQYDNMQQSSRRTATFCASVTAHGARTLAFSNGTMNVAV